MVSDTFAFEPHDDALDRRRVPIQAKDSFGFLVGVAQGPEVAYQDRHAVGLSDNYIAEVVETVHQSDAADDEILIAARNGAAARIRGIVVDCVDDVVDPQPVTQEFGRVEIESKLAGKPPEIIDFCNTGNPP
jgi:hypothetical protein